MGSELGVETRGDACLEKRFRKSWKTALYAALLTGYTASSMYLGDALNLQKKLSVLKDEVAGVRIAKGFANYYDLDIVTKVEAGARKTYLYYHPPGLERITRINEKGYAYPPTPLERFKEFLKEKEDWLRKEKHYDSWQRFKDKVELAVKYYKLKLKEFVDKHF